jgi:hypothetical protein
LIQYSQPATGPFGEESRDDGLLKMNEKAAFAEKKVTYVTQYTGELP